MTDELTPIIERIRRHIRHDHGHWIWTGALDRSGYAAIHVHGHTLRVHRILWQIAHGDTGRRLWNHCRHRHCVHPDHWQPRQPEREWLTRSQTCATI